jgi:hypothetical protein
MTPTLREAAAAALDYIEAPSSKLWPAGTLHHITINLRAALAQPVPDAEPVAWVLSPTDIYDFAGWLTTRPGTLVVGSLHEAGPMAEAVGEYLRKFPDRFAAHPQPAPLTDTQLCAMRKQNLDDSDSPAWAYEKGMRDAEQAHGIVPAPTTDQSHPQR